MNHHATLIRTSDVFAYEHPTTDEAVILSQLDKFGIDDVRLITQSAHIRPTTDAGQVFVVRTTFVTHEAQNALLKLFEEPPVLTRFVLVVPHAFQLLPTLNSRIGVEETIQQVEPHDAWKVFASASIGDRIKQIDSWNKTKDPQWLRQIVAGVHTIDVSKLTAREADVVRLVGERLQTRGASNKMLLEHIALTLPLLK